jgi:flagellum-specific ATP synthase
VPGSDPQIDAAITARGPIDAFLKQGVTELSTAEQADALLAQLALLEGSFEGVPLAALEPAAPDVPGTPLTQAIPPLHIPT